MYDNRFCERFSAGDRSAGVLALMKLSIAKNTCLGYLAFGYVIGYVFFGQEQIAGALRARTR